MLKLYFLILLFSYKIVGVNINVIVNELVFHNSELSKCLDGPIHPKLTYTKFESISKEEHVKIRAKYPNWGYVIKI